MKALYLIVIIAISLFAACNEKDMEKQKKNIEEVPPSLQQNNEDKELVKLTDKEAETLQIKTTRVTKTQRHFSIVSPGIAEPAPDYISMISTPIDGRIVRNHANEGDKVSQGQILMEIESLEFGKLISDYLKAEAEASYLKSKYERTQKLVEEQISSQSELEQIESSYARARTTANATESVLKAVGVSGKEINNYKEQEDINPIFKVRSPISGIVDAHLVDLGQSVKSYEKLASVINTEVVLVKAYISPQEGEHIKPGDSVVIDRRNQNSKQLSSIVNSLNPSLDEGNRSLVANILVKPINNWPMPGENLRATIFSSSNLEVIAIPLKAITYEEDKAVVFVKKPGHVYEKRFIRLLDTQENLRVVTAGLKEGEEIAISQVFSLKALARYERFAD